MLFLVGMRNQAVEQSPGKAAAQDGDLFRHIVESAIDFAVFAVNASGDVAAWNIGAERLTGYSEQEILGRTGDVIFTSEDRAAGAPERERSTAARSGRSVDERWHQRKDGSRFWGSGLMMPLRTGNGFVKIMRDQTAQRLKELELSESEGRFRMLATSIPQLVFRSAGNGARTWGVRSGRSTPAYPTPKVGASVGWTPYILAIAR
jgi:PAS domain S-box-containing protein